MASHSLWVMKGDYYASVLFLLFPIKRHIFPLYLPAFIALANRGGVGAQEGETALPNVIDFPSSKEQYAVLNG